MKAQHITHKPDEWFDIIDEDPDYCFDTGVYIGVRDNLKFSDGHWYAKSECVYRSKDGVIKSCCH